MPGSRCEVVRDLINRVSPKHRNGKWEACSLPRTFFLSFLRPTTGVPRAFGPRLSPYPHLVTHTFSPAQQYPLQGYRRRTVGGSFPHHFSSLAYAVLTAWRSGVHQGVHDRRQPAQYCTPSTTIKSESPTLVSYTHRSHDD